MKERITKLQQQGLSLDRARQRAAVEAKIDKLTDANSVKGLAKDVQEILNEMVRACLGR